MTDDRIDIYTLFALIHIIFKTVWWYTCAGAMQKCGRVCTDESGRAPEQLRQQPTVSLFIHHIMQHNIRRTILYTVHSSNSIRES